MLRHPWKHAVYLPVKIGKKRLHSNQRNCALKIAYLTAEEAEDAALKMMDSETIYKVQPYQCAVCRWFHIGGPRRYGGGRVVQPRYLYHERQDYGRVNGRPTTESRWWIQMRDSNKVGEQLSGS